MPAVTTGINESMAKYARIIEAARSAASVAAVKAGSQPIYDRSQDTVPVDRGVLKASGVIIEPELTPDGARGGVRYGNADTLTDWQGMGYEIFVELGSSHRTYRIPPNPFLGTATSEARPEIIPAMGQAFGRSLREAVA